MLMQNPPLSQGAGLLTKLEIRGLGDQAEDTIFWF